MTTCRYLVAPDEFAVVTPDGREMRAASPRMLCAWAIYHPASPAALAEAPRWMAREALTGHLWRPGDCVGCPGHQAGAPVETPREAR